MESMGFSWGVQTTLLISVTIHEISIIKNNDFLKNVSQLFI
jgi:hypothetical protein